MIAFLADDRDYATVLRLSSSQIEIIRGLAF